jgi:hypothetical protein
VYVANGVSKMTFSEPGWNGTDFHSRNKDSIICLVSAIKTFRLQSSTHVLSATSVKISLFF